MPDFSFEQELLVKGYTYVAGIDEAGRGPLAGSVFASAVILVDDLLGVFAEYVKDSKKLSAKKRGELNDLIKVTCVWGIGEATPIEIDTINILNATKLAIYRAVSFLPSVDYLLIDGNMGFSDIFDLPYESIVKGDDKCLSIAAASILAKEAQCSHMVSLDKLYPGYGFIQHKGYGTKKHIEAIKELGPCEMHRKTFKRVREYC